MARHRQFQHQHEFLPLCDVLFNIISLASYFCDVVFDFAMAYALAYHAEAPPILFPLSVTLIVASLVISQVVSARWYLWGARGKLIKSNGESNEQREGKSISWTMCCVLLLHSTQVGVLWRYFKLFIPVDLAYVKHEVRELCVLRLIHAFCEAAPMLLLQLYLLSIGMERDGDSVDGKIKDIDARGNDNDKLTELTAVSAGLSLWSVCWAVASFSKGAARLRNLERLVLTWLGVLAQLAWRLGTVSARVGALVAYASLYGGQWLLVVLALHWLSMLMWLLLTPDGLFHGGERLPFFRKTFLASLLAVVYVFAYVNLHETNHRQKMIIFYTVMFLENSLLIGVWTVGVHQNDFDRIQNHPKAVTLILTLLALFFGGLFFMGLYYRFFHVRRLRYEAGGRMNVNGGNTLSNQDHTEEKQTTNCDNGKEENANIRNMRKMKLGNGGIPGVFNCRFANPAVPNNNRKKKKPTSFVPPPSPPPPPPPPQTLTSVNDNGNAKAYVNNSNGNTKQLIAFWRRPLPVASQQSEDSNGEKNDTDVSVAGSLSVNLIREKLREKKQQQLRELRAIQEEIKEGKLVPPPSASTSSFSSNPSASNQQPPPNTKLHTSPNGALTAPSGHSFEQMEHNTDDGGVVPLTSWPPIKMHCSLPPPPSSPYHPKQQLPLHSSNHQWKITSRERADTPEILLAPRCLPHHYPHWIPGHNTYRLRLGQSRDDDNCKGESIPEGGGISPSIENENDLATGDMSDMEGSQLSLPRSYTLPREFKYNNNNNNNDSNNSYNTSRERRINNKLPPPTSRFYLPSTNSSDGDVDSSADNEEETDSELQITSKKQHDCAFVNEKIHHQKRYTFETCGNHSNEHFNYSNHDNQQINGNLYGVLRSNQLLRTRVKHETKL